MGRLVRSFAQKHHYKLTKLKNIKLVEEKQFEKNILIMANFAYNNKIPLLLIRIADCGKEMIAKTYQCQEDVNTYNQILYNITLRYSNVFLLDPYSDKTTEEYLLNDGHHLNIIRHQAVYYTILNWFSSAEKHIIT